MTIEFSFARLGAMLLRYLYLLRGSWPRVLELAYWPTVQMVLWGLITRFFQANSSWVAQASGVLLAAALLWDVMFRGQLGVSLVFFEELYSRNLGQLFASPLRSHELVCALLGVSFLRTLIGVGVAALLAIPLYHYSIFTLGWPLIAFFSNLLVMGWAIGLLVAGLVLRYGLGAESLAWVAVFAIAPISGIYYPVDTLPEWLRPLAWALPSSYIFEGMRKLMFARIFDLKLLAMSMVFNGIYLTCSVTVFLSIFRIARREGLLLRTGE